MEVLSNRPATAESLRQQADLMVQSGQMPLALDLLRQAERLAPRASEVQVDLAVVCYQLEQHGEALRHCSAALALDDTLDECVFLQALCLQALGEAGLVRGLLQELLSGARAARFSQRAPEMARQAAEMLASAQAAHPAAAAAPAVVAQAPVQAASAPAPATGVGGATPIIRLPSGLEARSVREFIWGDQDPYQLFPKHPTTPPQKGWYSDHPVFEQLIVERRPRQLLEVGSLFGGSAIHIGQLVKKHQIDGALTCVDTFLGSCEHYIKGCGFWRRMLASGRYNFFDEFLGNVDRAGVSDVVTPFVQTSTNAARLFKEIGMKFDFIYLDASHEYVDVLADLHAWYPLLAPGGVLVGDDFEEPWFEIIRAVMEFAEEIHHPLQISRAFASSPIGGRDNTKYLFYAR
ncbi:class I SAM-dependent methyltransferase [Ideonella dechloratans]|uniref:class I SAM-dependent methyltransferase n=1 Tax=Ideonella dechloratans TaxID=36863 RepID=UPI0035B4597E